MQFWIKGAKFLCAYFDFCKVNVLSSGQLHPLLTDYSSSLSDFPNLLSHGNNGSFMKLSFKGYSFAGTQAYGFIPYCNKPL